MFSPCECCTYKTEHREGHRIITGCKDEEKAKGVKYKEMYDAVMESLSKLN